MDWKTRKNVNCGTSITDNKITALFCKAKRCQKLNIFLQQIRTIMPTPLKIFSVFYTHLTNLTTFFEDNKGACDYVNVNKDTSNLCHVEIPLRYSNEIHKLGIV